MLSPFEIRIFHHVLLLASKYEFLYFLQYDAKKQTVVRFDRNHKLFKVLGQMIIFLELGLILTYVSLARSSSTQISAVLSFLILPPTMAIGARLTAITYNNELVSLMNNILQTNKMFGKIINYEMLTLICIFYASDCLSR